MKGLVTVFLFWGILSQTCIGAHVLADKIKPYLLETDTKNNKSQRNKSEPKKYDKKIEDARYIALYFSNPILDKKFKSKLDSVTDYISNLESDKRYKDQEIPGNIEFVYVTKSAPTSTKEIKYKFPYIDQEKGKRLSSVNRFSPRNGPGLVVVSTSGQIVYRGQPEQVIKALEKLIPVEKKQKK